MDILFRSDEIEIGFHPDGFRIDKTASPMNRYTKWETCGGRRWSNPKPVCFHSLPENGWIKIDKFNWDIDKKLNLSQI